MKHVVRARFLVQLTEPLRPYSNQAILSRRVAQAAANEIAALGARTLRRSHQFDCVQSRGPRAALHACRRDRGFPGVLPMRGIASALDREREHEGGTYPWRPEPRASMPAVGNGPATGIDVALHLDARSNLRAHSARRCESERPLLTCGIAHDPSGGPFGKPSRSPPPPDRPNQSVGHSPLDITGCGGCSTDRMAERHQRTVRAECRCGHSYVPGCRREATIPPRSDVLQRARRSR